MDRKSIFICFGVTCLAILAGYGVSKTVSDDTDLKVLTLHSVEALADGEDATWGGWNNFWKGQGFWKDEREWKRPCGNTNISGNASGEYEGASGSAGGSYSNTTVEGREEITCPTGNKNCSPIGC